MHDKKRQRCEQLCSLGQAKHAQEVSTFFSENLTQHDLLMIIVRPCAIGQSRFTYFVHIRALNRKGGFLNVGGIDGQIKSEMYGAKL